MPRSSGTVMSWFQVHLATLCVSPCKRDIVVNFGRETTNTGILSGIVQQHGVATSAEMFQVLLIGLPGRLASLS
jgi:hypothetical protein